MSQSIASAVRASVKIPIRPVTNVIPIVSTQRTSPTTTQQVKPITTSQITSVITQQKPIQISKLYPLVSVKTNTTQENKSNSALRTIQKNIPIQQEEQKTITIQKNIPLTKQINKTLAIQRNMYTQKNIPRAIPFFRMPIPRIKTGGGLFNLPKQKKTS